MQTYFLRDNKVAASNLLIRCCKVYECPICGRRFKKLYGLASHMHRCHMPAGDYVCPACGRSFRGFQGLLCHIAKSVGDPEHAKYYILYTTATSRGRNVC